MMPGAKITAIGIIMSLFLISIVLPIGTLNEEALGSPGQTRSLPRNLPNDEWPMFRGGATRTGNTTAEGTPDYNLTWSLSLGITWSSPVVKYDQIYVNLPSNTRCYDMNGNLVWNYRAGNNYGAPMVYNGSVYFSADNGTLYSLSANATGPSSTTVNWIFDHPGVTGSHNGPCTDGEKIYYTAMDTPALYAVWLSNGTMAWNASLGGSTSSESSPAYWNGRVYCGGGFSWGGGSNGMYCINATNGNLIWTYNANSPICTTPVVEYNRVYFGALNGRVMCVDAIGSGSSTTRYWEYNTASTMGVLGSPSVAYGKVYVGATNGKLYCLDAIGSGGTTTSSWDVSLTPAGPYGICASPAVTPKYVFVSTTGNGMHCRNRTNGDLVWTNTFSPSGMYGMCTSPAVYKDKVLCASDNGNFYIIKPIIDLIPPHVQSTTPGDGAINVGLMDNISVKFDEVIDIETLTTSSLILKDSQDNTVAGTISSDMSIETAYFTPDEPFLKEETYTFTVTTDIMDLKKNTLDGNGNNLMEGPGVDEYTISFTTIPFYSPTIGSIPTLRPVEDVPFTRNLSGSINDLDTPKYDLTLTENTSYGSLDGFELNLLYPNGVTSDKINLTVSDGLFTVYKPIDVAVKSVNDPPEITELSTLDLTEDVTHTINLLDQVTDIDTPFSQLSFYENSSYGRVEDMYFNLTYPEGITYEYVNLTVFDEDYSDSTEIQITIEPVNDPPEIDMLPPVTVKEDTPFELSLETFISDVDTPQNELEILVESSNVEVTGFTLTLTYNERIGTDTLDVKVFDGEYYDNATLEVTVDPINHPPVIVKIISPMEGDVYEHDDSIDFQAEVDDEDLAHGDTLTYLWHDLKKGDIAETQNAMDIVLAPGEHFISFVVTDDFGGRATANVNITVKEKPTPVTPPDNTTNTTGDGDDDGDDKKDESSSTDLVMMAGIGIVIVIIILAIIGLVITKRKKKVTEESTLAQQAQAQAAQMQVPQQTFQQYPDMAQQQLLMQQFAQAPGQVQAPADPSLFYGPMPGDTTGIDPSLLYGPSYNAPAPAIDSSLQYPQLPPSTDSQAQTEQTTEAIEGELGTTESQVELQQLPEQLTTPEPTGPQLNTADQIDPNDPLQQARTFDLPVSETTSLDTSTSTAKDENKDSESNTESG